VKAASRREPRPYGMTKHHVIVILSAVSLSLSFFLSLAAGAQPEGKTLRIASLSMLPAKWDKESNARKLDRMIRQAAAKGAQLIVTPEGALEGYVIGQVLKAPDFEAQSQRFFELAEPLDGIYLRKFCRLSAELGVHLVLGFLEKDGSHLHNSAALISPEGKILGVYHKNHRNQGFYHPSFYYPGDEIPVFDTTFGKVGILICFDRQIPEVARCLALQGARLILNPSYGSTGEWNDALVRTRAYENEAVYVFTHPRQSLIVDSKGRVVSRSDTADSMAIADVLLPADPPKKARERRPELYGIISQGAMRQRPSFPKMPDCSASRRACGAEPASPARGTDRKAPGEGGSRAAG
jgi:predicted amidohydrolase